MSRAKTGFELTPVNPRGRERKVVAPPIKTRNSICTKHEESYIVTRKKGLSLDADTRFCRRSDGVSAEGQKEGRAQESGFGSIRRGN